jgi:dipeptidyl aminopeptidase/acylaminoacyl peptidase
MEARVVHFFSEGSRLEGDYFVPSDVKPGERRPAIVLCHGYSGIRKVVLPDYAKLFAAAGYVALSFDYRGFGGSEGPKWRIMALEQVDDIRNAITWLETQPEVDPERIGLWGTSNGGAHAPYVAGVDERVKAAVGQVGYGDGRDLIMDGRSDDERKALLHRLREDARKRVTTGKGDAVTVDVLLASSNTRKFFAEALKVMPELYSEIPWASAQKTIEYRPIDVVDRIAPRALLLIGAEKDELCRFEGYRRLFERAREPKKLVALPITHYEVYGPPWMEKSARIAIEWYDEHLK